MSPISNDPDYFDLQMQALLDRLSEFDPVFEFLDDGSVIAIYVDGHGKLRQEFLLTSDGQPPASSFSVNMAPGSEYCS